jgi:hypothetical protein
MSAIPHQHMHRVNFEKCYTFKTTSCQNLKICEISKGVSKIIPWSSHLKSSFVYKRLWNSVFSFPFFVMVYWKSLSNWSLAVNHDDLVASIPFPASQVETVKVENFLEQSRFLNSQHGKVIHRAFILDPCFKSSESSKEVRRGSIEALCYASLCCYRKHQALYTELFSFCSPSRSII